MIERVSGNTKAEIFAFDFRARTDEKTNEGGVASIWLSSIVGDDTTETRKNIKDFLDLIIERSAKQNVCLYCFDLAFHWSFLAYELFDRGYCHARRMRKDSVKKFNVFCTSNASTVYSAMIKVSKGHGIIFLKDLKQVYAGYKSLDEMAKSFKSDRPFFPDDLEKEHPEGAEPTENEKSNSVSRSSFIFDVLKAQEKDAAFFQAFTLASYSLRRAILHAFGHLKSPYMAYRSQKMYPRITDEDEKKALIASKKGGLTGPTIAAIDRGFQINQRCFVIDRTQSYPSEMKESKLPRGTGTLFDGFDTGGGIRLFYVQINSFDGVRIHSIPVLMQGHLHFMPPGSPPIRIWIWEWEYYQAFSCYINLDCEVLGGYLYREGRCPFGPYVEENQRIRNEFEAKGDFIQAAHYKALNVTIYGKLIQRDSKETITQTLDEETGLTVTERKEREEARESSYVYLPAGSAIPSLARWHLIKLAKRFGYENVVYVETDSLIVLENEHTKEVLASLDLNKQLGHWHLESVALEAYFPMAKRYKYKTEDGRAVVKGAGIDSSAFSGLYDEIKITDTEIEMRQKKAAPGGTLLIKVRKKLKGERKDENTNPC